MKEVLEQLNQLSSRYPKDVKLYLQNKESVIKLMKGTGRVPGKFNPDLLDFLTVTNGASVLDYCFLGFKNQKLGYDLDKYMLDFWHDYNRYALMALPFMKTSQNENFCLWLDPGDAFYSVVYVNADSEASPIPVGSNFLTFMRTFVTDVADSLLKGDNLYITKDSWPLNHEHWLRNDINLLKTTEVFNRMRI